MSMSNDNQANKFKQFLTWLEAMLSTVKQAESATTFYKMCKHYQFEVTNIYCQLKEIMVLKRGKFIEQSYGHIWEFKNVLSYPPSD